MEGYIILTIGFILIFISILLIFRSDNKTKLIYEDILKKHQEISEYVTTIDKLIDNLDDLISKTLMNINLTSKKNNQNSDIACNDKNFNISEKKVNILVNNEEHEVINNNYDELFTLKKIGYKNDEIAKKLNMGIREVEIILKMRGYID